MVENMTKKNEKEIDAWKMVPALYFLRNDIVLGSCGIIPRNGLDFSIAVYLEVVSASYIQLLEKVALARF